MIKNANTKIMLGTSSWREQFAEALTISGGNFLSKKSVKHPPSGDDDDGDDEGDGGEKEPEEPGCFDYFMHVLAVPWKLIFSTIPPTGSDSIE